MLYRAFIGALLAILATASAAQPRTLTLEEALRRAEEISPAVGTAGAQLAAGEAEAREANAFLWNNPVLSADLTRRRISSAERAEERANEWALGIAQAFETGGQAAHRRAAASASRESLAYAVPEARRRLRADVAARFFHALSLQQRVALEGEAQRVADEAAVLAAKRVRAGEDSRLDGNLARIEAERARNQAAAARESLVRARAELASLLQLPLASLGEVTGDLAAPTLAGDRDAMLERVAQRPDILALERRVEATRRRAQLERAARAPDVTLGIVGGRDGPAEGRERFTTLAISVPLPIFRRNEAGIGRSVAELTQAELEHRAALSGARAELAGLLERQATLEERVRRLATEVLPALDENLRLSRRAREAGEIAVPQLLLVTRQAVEARRELLEAQTEHRLVAVAIETATVR